MKSTLDDRLIAICREFSPDYIREKRETSYERVGFYNKALSDILHKLEFGKLDAIGRTRYVNKLINVLIERRKYKDEHERYRAISKSGIFNRANKLKAVIDRQNKRKFTPRVLEECFID